MWDHGWVRWLPIVFFALLGLFFCDRALRRSARRTWAWGRTGGGPPLSRVSYAAWGLTFFAIAYTVAHAPAPGMMAVVLIGICFVAVMISGIADTRAARKGGAVGEQRGTKGPGRDPDECQNIE